MNISNISRNVRSRRDSSKADPVQKKSEAGIRFLPWLLLLSWVPRLKLAPPMDTQLFHVKNKREKGSPTQCASLGQPWGRVIHVSMGNSRVVLFPKEYSARCCPFWTWRVKKRNHRLKCQSQNHYFRLAELGNRHLNIPSTRDIMLSCPNGGKHPACRNRGKRE